MYGETELTVGNLRHSDFLRLESTRVPIADDFSQIVSTPPSFNAFFPLQPALNEGLLSVVSNVPVADCNREFPMFRTRVVTPDGQHGPWWIWDGQNEEMIERELTASEKRYSLRGIISAPLLVERIEKAYRPETHDV